MGLPVQSVRVHMPNLDLGVGLRPALRPRRRGPRHDAALRNAGRAGPRARLVPERDTPSVAADIAALVPALRREPVPPGVSASASLLLSRGHVAVVLSARVSGSGGWADSCGNQPDAVVCHGIWDGRHGHRSRSSRHARPRPFATGTTSGLRSTRLRPHRWEGRRGGLAPAPFRRPRDQSSVVPRQRLSGPFSGTETAKAGSPKVISGGAVSCGSWWLVSAARATRFDRATGHRRFLNQRQPRPLRWGP